MFIAYVNELTYQQQMQDKCIYLFFIYINLIYNDIFVDVVVVVVFILFHDNISYHG
jgi:hypothetical protein